MDKASEEREAFQHEQNEKSKELEAFISTLRPDHLSSAEYSEIMNILKECDDVGEAKAAIQEFERSAQSIGTMLESFVEQRRRPKSEEAMNNDHDEVMAEIAYMAGGDGLQTEDSRYVISEFIRWAREFDCEHKDTVWDSSDDEHDYMIQIEKFYLAKRTLALQHDWEMNGALGDLVAIDKYKLLAILIEWEVSEYANRLLERIQAKAKKDIIRDQQDA